MVDYLIVAGPQAAGKSTLLSSVVSGDPSVKALQESRKLVIHQSQKKGAIFMTPLDEVEVIHLDMTRMFSILCQPAPAPLYIDETNIFTLAHARAHGIDLLKGYFQQYCDLLRAFRTGVIFVDVPPEVSWERRRAHYAQRLLNCTPEEKEQTMSQYRSYLDKLYPELLTLFDSLDFPKTKIDGSLPPEQLSQAASKAVLKLLVPPVPGIATLGEYTSSNDRSLFLCPTN